MHTLHNTGRIPLAVLAAAALVAGVSGCAQGTQEAPAASDSSGAESITVNYSAPVPGALPFLPVDIALEQGFFEEEGIELVTTQTAAQALPAALSSGQLDMTADTAYNVARYLESGVEMRFVSGLNDNVDFTLLAANGVDIPAPGNGEDGWKDSFAAMEGFTIGTAAKAGPIGLSVAKLLEEAGVPAGSYTLIDTPGAASGNALAAGQVQAVVSGGGFDAPLVANGLATPVLSFGKDIPNIFGDQVNAALSMTEPFIKANPEAPAKVQRAITKAIAYIQDPANADAVVAAAVAAGTPETDSLSDKISSYVYESALSKSGLKAAFAWAKDAGISSKVIDSDGAIAPGVETR